VSISSFLAVAPGEAVAEQRPEDERVAMLAVENMRCGGCMRAVEKAVSAVPGVSHARTNLSARRVTVVFNALECGEEDFVAALAEAGFKAAPMTPGETAAGDDPGRDYLRRVGVAGFAAANIMLLSIAVWAGSASDMAPATEAFFYRLSALIAIPAVIYAGQPFFRSAYGALKARRLNMDVPISLAVILATAMSCWQMLKGSDQVYFDASITLLFFLLIGRWLDQRLRRRARGEAGNLLSLQNGFATVLAADGSARSVPAHALQPGDRVLVAAGERVPADGIASTDAGQIDQSLITGESQPVAVEAGAPVYAGTLNLAQPFRLDVTAADTMTLLAEISRLMENAEQGRASYRRLADRAAAIYAPAVHILGAVTFLGWLALGAGWESALTSAIAVLIITCPCALALAVPAVHIAAASRLFRMGVILKEADALERMAEADAIIFDKTGTLTLGRPSLGNADELDDETLAAAAGLAAASRHPYARAVVDAALRRLDHVAPAAGVTEQPGQGLERPGPAGNARLGSARWCGIAAPGSKASLWYCPADGGPFPFEFNDALRPDAHEVVNGFKEDGLIVGLLSGDRAEAVQAAAKSAGIADWRAQLTPAGKIAELRKIGASQKILMVGDGLNDAAALATAHVSASPADAADITLRAADVVFQGERLSPLLDAVRLARRARSMAFQNFAVALGYNLVCVPLAMAGMVTPLVAAIAMSTSSLLVTANALRLAGDGGRRDAKERQET